jgi:hypothetical protein
MLILLGLVAVGLAGTAVTLTHREADAAFEFHQRHPGQVSPQKLAEAVGKAREPVPGNNGTRSVSSRCKPHGRGELGNPWQCTVRYRSGRRVTYFLAIQTDGSFRGANKAGDRSVVGRLGAPPGG